jgi:hypothetical protein
MLAAVTACGAFGACGVRDAVQGFFDGGAGASPGCAFDGGAPPLANLGPDLTLRVLCGTGSRGAIASVNEPAPGATRWMVSLEGDPHFSLEATSFLTCENNGPTVAFVDLQPATGAVPGDRFEAVATITADGDAFPTTNVALHGEVVAPNVSAPSVLDFGDVPFGAAEGRMLRFINASPSPVALFPNDRFFPPFTLATAAVPTPSTTVTTWTVTLADAAPGDYSIPTTWTATPSPTLTFPQPCLWTQTITLRVHVLDAPDGGTDAGRDGGRDVILSPIIP